MSQDSFIPAVPATVKFPKWVYQSNYRTIDSSNVAEALREVVKADDVAWDTEFDPTPSGHVVSAFSFSTAENTGWLLPVRMDHIPNLSISVAEKFVLAFSKKRNICQAAGAEMRSVKHTWPDHWEDLLNITDDIMVLWYQKDPNESKDFKESSPRRRGGAPSGFSLEAMALKYLKLEIPSLGDYFKDHKFRELDPDTARLYACSDADVTRRLWKLGGDHALLNSFTYKLDMALLRVLLDIEERGLLFDPERMAEIEKEIRVLVADTRVEAYAALHCDESVNIDSPTQLARHLYNVLNWPIIGKKRKDGLGSTDKTVLARLAESSDPKISAGASAFTTYKKWKTLHNNFLTKLHTYQNPVTGAIHSRFLSTVVPTGRLANAGPNLQQIPQRNPKAPLRRAFRARPGHYFLEADYSQIELRVYAGETQEKFFFDAFINGTDLHLQTASVIFREKISDKNDPRRQFGKTMNFGPIYGMKPEGLSMRTEYTFAEAERILDDFFGAMPDAVQWTKDCHRKAKDLGGVHTHFQRWRPLPWLHSRLPHEVEFGERSAVNTIIQGTAADIMKIGLIRIWKALRKPDCPYHGRAFLVLTIHDSVMLEVHESVDPHEFFEWIKPLLCFHIEGYPPLDIDAKIGRNWHDMEELETESATPESEAFEDVHKELPIPSGSEGLDFIPALLDLIRKASTEPGNYYLSFVGASGPMGGVICTTAEHYQRILQFLVGVARDNSASTNGANKEMKVSFV